MNNQKQIHLLEATINQELVDVADCQDNILEELEGVGYQDMAELRAEIAGIEAITDRGEYLLDLIEHHDLREYYGQYSVGYVAGLRMAINLLKNL